MHEGALCAALLARVEAVARAEGALRVSRVRLRVGPLAGVEPELLARAYAVARAGTLAADAALAIEASPVHVRCRDCGTEAAAAPGHLRCGACGSAATQLLSGDELLLAGVDLVAAVDGGPDGVR
jgi:hydrogenase nickel incorporation protein HypA/HybF